MGKRLRAQVRTHGNSNSFRSNKLHGTNLKDPPFWFGFASIEKIIIATKTNFESNVFRESARPPQILALDDVSEQLQFELRAA